MPTSLRPSHARLHSPTLRPTRRNTVRPLPQNAPRSGDARLDVIVHGLDPWGTPGRGEFVFSMTVRNSGSDPARDLHVWLEMPHTHGVHPDHDLVHLWGHDAWLPDALAPAQGWRFTRPDSLEPGEIAALEVTLRLQQDAPARREDAILPATAGVRSTTAGNRPTIPLWFNLR